MLTTKFAFRFSLRIYPKHIFCSGKSQRIKVEMTKVNRGNALYKAAAF